jgi:hypothetical protein
MSDNDAPFSLEKRATWPVPKEVQGASAVDAFMWYAADGLHRIFPTYRGPETVFYTDFGRHEIRCGPLRLTLEWGLDDYEGDS